MKTHKAQVVFWEMVLIVATIPVFRSVWMLLDDIPLMNSPAGLYGSLAIGVILSLVALRIVNNGAQG
jgi:hypothetical protein